MEERIKRISRELKYKGSIVDVYEDCIAMPDGTTESWDYIAHRKGAAAVVPITQDGKILMVHQYRNALDRDTIEIPAGARDSVTEDTKDCAMRELEEETGYKSIHLTKLLSLKTTVAFCNELVDVYLATDLEPGVQNLDPAEYINIKAYEPEELLELIYAGTIQDAKTVAGILAYCNKYRNNMK